MLVNSYDAVVSKVQDRFSDLVFSSFVLKLDDVIVNENNFHTLLNYDNEYCFKVISALIGFASFTDEQALSYAKVQYIDISQIPKVEQDDFPSMKNLDDSLIAKEVESIFCEVAKRLKVVPYDGLSSECTMREFISPLLVGALNLLDGSVKLQGEKEICGFVGNGPVDYVMEYRSYQIVLTEAKKLTIKAGIKQNIAQIVASKEDFAKQFAFGDDINSKKRKYKDAFDAIDLIPSFGIVATGAQWVFIKRYKSGEEYALAESKPLDLFLPQHSPIVNERTKAEMLDQIKSIVTLIVGIVQDQVEQINNCPLFKKSKVQPT